MAVARTKPDTTGTVLAALDVPTTGGCTGAARKAAWQRLAAMGLPARRDEYWKYTNPLTFIAAEAVTADVTDTEDGFAGLKALRLVFVDGVFDADLSDDLTATGCTIERLANLAAADIHWAHDIYGQLEARGQNPVARPLAALNTAHASDGAVIRVTGRVARPIELVYRRDGSAADVMLHHVIRLETGGEMTLLEDGAGGARFNSVLEVDVADGASFHHIRAQGSDHASTIASHVFVRLGTGAAFKSFTLSGGGRLTRNEVVLELTGDNSVAHVAGAAMGEGNFHHDDTVFITHDAQHCESRQVFKKVLKSGSTGVFQGKILVKKGAQKTDGYQISQALLLDDDAQFLAKPELEIYADDVACSHGSTSGAIDDEALFYLRSRGVGEAQAKGLLVLAFLAEAVAEIEDPAVSENILARLGLWLERHQTS